MSVRLEIEWSLARARAPNVLCFALEQDTLSSAKFH